MTSPLPAFKVAILEQCWREGTPWNAAMLAGDVSELTVARYFRRFREAGIPRGPRERGSNHTNMSVPIPADVLADRDRRARLAPRSIVAAIAGDPLPGYSALERLNAF